MRFRNGSCTDCGNADTQCECLVTEGAKQEARRQSKVFEFLERINDPTDAFKCFDCYGFCDTFMVHDHVWIKAWPTYREDKMELKSRSSGMGMVVMGRQITAHAALCFTCIEVRLDRHLEMGDFTAVVVNYGIRLGYRMGRAFEVESGG